MRIKTQRNSDEILRDEMFLQDKVLGFLKACPKTIPEIAQEMGYPSQEITKWVMALRRYGKIMDIPKSRADDYYKYKLVEGK